MYRLLMAVGMTWPQYLRRECTVGEFTVKLSPHEAEVLLFLLLRCPNPVSRDEVLEWLYQEPDVEPDYAMGNVHSTIRNLKQKIGGFHVVSRLGYGYRLRQHPDTPPKRGRRRGKRGPPTRPGEAPGSLEWAGCEPSPLQLPSFRIRDC
jgi:hypothetical protein